MRTNFKMEDKNITMTKGDTLSFNMTVTDQHGNAFTVDTCNFTCKKLATNETNVFKKSLGAGITQDDEIITVRVAPEDTRNVDAGEYFYDCEIGVGDDVFTLMKGILTIEQDVTF